MCVLTLFTKIILSALELQYAWKLYVVNNVCVLDHQLTGQCVVICQTDHCMLRVLCVCFLKINQSNTLNGKSAEEQDVFLRRHMTYFYF